VNKTLKTLLVLAPVLGVIVLFYQKSYEQDRKTSDDVIIEYISKPAALESNNSLADLDSTLFYESMIIEDAASPLPYWNRAGWHLRNGRISEGLYDLDLAIEADSTYGPAWSAKADALYFIQKFERSIKHLDICLEYSPNHIPCKLRRAEFYIHLDQFEDAFTLLNDALKLNDQLHEAYWMKGKIYQEVGEIEKSLSSFQTAVEVNPEFFDGFIALGIAYSKLGDNIAIEYYRSAIAINPVSVEAKYNLAMHYQEAVMLDEAMALYEEILDIDSTNATAAFNSGFIQLEFMQDYSEAEIWFSDAIHMLPHYHVAFYYRGITRESQNDLTLALDDYNEALRLKPDYTAAAIAKGRVIDSMK